MKNITLTFSHTFSGQWNQSGAVLEDDAPQPITVEQSSVNPRNLYVAAGCQRGYLSFDTATKLALTMLSAIRVLQPDAPKFRFKLTYRSNRNIVLHNVTAATVQTTAVGFRFIGGDGVPLIKWHSLDDWILSIEPIPTTDLLARFYDLIPIDPLAITS